MSETAFLAAGAALYAGEGTKRDGAVSFANTDSAMVAFCCSWLRTCFDVDEERLRGAVYLHEGLDPDRAEEFWSSLSGIPRSPVQEGVPGRSGSEHPSEQARARLRVRLLLLFPNASPDHGADSRPAIFERLFRGSSIRQSTRLLIVGLWVRVPPPEPVRQFPSSSAERHGTVTESV